MPLPFTAHEFFDVFGAYNLLLWPAAFALWLLSAWALARLLRAPQSRFVSGVLVLHWAWSAIAYHALFFARINPAAWVFSGLFLVEATLLAWYGLVRSTLQFRAERSMRGVLAVSLLGYALAYPLLALAGAHAWPRVPIFGVPCPTALLTIGYFVAATPRVPIALVLVPLVWAVIGGSAAWLLGVHPDLLLPIAGALLLAHCVTVRRSPLPRPTLG